VTSYSSLVNIPFYYLQDSSIVLLYYEHLRLRNGWKTLKEILDEQIVRVCEVISQVEVFWIAMTSQPRRLRLVRVWIALNWLRMVSIGKKVKLSLCLTKHHAMKAYRWSGGIAQRIL
jgi:hypothetical protein